MAGCLACEIAVHAQVKKRRFNFSSQTGLFLIVLIMDVLLDTIDCSIRVFQLFSNFVFKL